MSGALGAKIKNRETNAVALWVHLYKLPGTVNCKVGAAMEYKKKLRLESLLFMRGLTL